MDCWATAQAALAHQAPGWVVGCHCQGTLSPRLSISSHLPLVAPTGRLGIHSSTDAVGTPTGGVQMALVV